MVFRARFLIQRDLATSTSGDHQSRRLVIQHHHSDEVCCSRTYETVNTSKLSKFCFGFGKWTLNLCLLSNLMNFFKKTLAIFAILCWNHQIWSNFHTFVIIWGRNLGRQENIFWGKCPPCHPVVPPLLVTWKGEGVACTGCVSKNYTILY